MTADEVAYAGGKYGTISPNTYYYLNSSGESVTGSNYWWTMTPARMYIGEAAVYYVRGSGNGNPGFLTYNRLDTGKKLRPVVSLSSGSLVTVGKGTANEPYEVK